MKKVYLFTMIAVFILLCTNGIQAQTTQTKLNQAELLKKFVGNWEGPAGKDTTQFTQFKNLQGNNILSLYTKGITQGKTVFEGTGFWSYDAAKNKIDLSVILPAGYVFHYLGEFTF